MTSEHDTAVLNSIFNPLLPSVECALDEELPLDLQDAEDGIENVKQAKNLEIEGVKAAESGDVDKALEIFTKAVNTAPNWASGHNNRAQAHRLKGNVIAAMKDLNEAIRLTGGQGRSGCQALCQRGIIYRKEGQNDLAREDFEAAAKLGSQFAKSQLVALNPYAALCNQMLYDVIGKLQQTNQN